MTAELLHIVLVCVFILILVGVSIIIFNAKPLIRCAVAIVAVAGSGVLSYQWGRACGYDISSMFMHRNYIVPYLHISRHIENQMEKHDYSGAQGNIRSVIDVLEAQRGYWRRPIMEQVEFMTRAEEIAGMAPPEMAP